MSSREIIERTIAKRACSVRPVPVPMPMIMHGPCLHAYVYGACCASHEPFVAAAFALPADAASVCSSSTPATAATLTDRASACERDGGKARVRIRDDRRRGARYDTSARASVGRSTRRTSPLARALLLPRCVEILPRNDDDSPPALALEDARDTRPRAVKTARGRVIPLSHRNGCRISMPLARRGVMATPGALILCAVTPPR